MLDHFQPGDRVTWAEPHPLDVGRVMQPTDADLAYFVEQGYPANRCVLVEWSGDDDGDGAWHDPAELRRLA